MTDLSTDVNLLEISIGSLLWNFLLSIILSFVLSWHFNLRAKMRFMRRDLGLVLPIICQTTLRVISVVKSSLALSLGLVEALSFVRFRTPIKEPEELAYIFISYCYLTSTGSGAKRGCRHRHGYHFGDHKRY